MVFDSTFLDQQTLADGPLLQLQGPAHHFCLNRTITLPVCRAVLCLLQVPPVRPSLLGKHFALWHLSSVSSGIYLCSNWTTGVCKQLFVTYVS